MENLGAMGAVWGHFVPSTQYVGVKGNPKPFYWVDPHSPWHFDPLAGGVMSAAWRSHVGDTDSRRISYHPKRDEVPHWPRRGPLIPAYQLISA